MTIATIKMTVPPEKRKEVLQTLIALRGQIRLEYGCISCNIFVDVEAENIIFFKEEWQTSEDLDTHLKSSYFSILIGAMTMLRDEPEIRFSTIATPAGAEAVTVARARKA